MRRVTKPGGPVVVADEIPGLHRAGLGHLLGIPSFDAWWLRRLGLDREFVKMVLEFDVDLPALWPSGSGPQAQRHRIWHGLGYCLGRDRSRVIEIVESSSVISGDSSCQPPAPKSDGIDPDVDVMDGTSTGIARAPGTARSASRPLRYDDARRPRSCCAGCATRLPIDDDILIVKDQTSDNNQVAQGFYDSPLWPKFRFWEWFTWFCNGGERRARNRVLRHLPTTPGLDLLDVAIGDGVYLDWLPRDWQIVGVDISRSQLDACRRRAAGRPVWLAQGEAEELPLASRQFDAVLSIGAFNYFNDPEGALREMVRVARPARPIVVSDEMPNLTDRMLGHKLGIPGARPLDRLAPDAPGRFLHRHGRTPPQSRRAGDRRASPGRLPVREGLARRRLRPRRPRSRLSDSADRTRDRFVRFTTLIAKNVVASPCPHGLDDRRAGGRHLGRGHPGRDLLELRAVVHGDLSDPRGSTWSSSAPGAPTSSRAAWTSGWATRCGRSRAWPRSSPSLVDTVGFEDKNLVSVLVNGWVPGSLLFRGIRMLDGRALQAGDDKVVHARPGPGLDPRQEGRRPAADRRRAVPGRRDLRER